MRRLPVFLLSISIVALAAQVRADSLERIELDETGMGFRLATSGKRFVPWGFNYDHDQQGRLLEAYWQEDWAEVEKSFAEMRQMGANVVRIHLQLGAVMNGAHSRNPDTLAQLKQLLDLAETHSLYLNLTGLGCYHKDEVPEWYDELSEAERWETQARFWEAVSEVGAKSSAVFCYDLMNEPVVPGGNQVRDDWLGPGFAGKHFVQFIALDRAERERAQVALQWIQRLKKSIRKHDPNGLITVGLVSWSLNRPGLTSGFDPDVIAEPLDFLAVHLYPEQGKVKEALETLEAYAAFGKPVVIEETFPLKCDLESFREFLTKAQSFAPGGISFYWGAPQEGNAQANNPLAAAITAKWLEMFRELTPTVLPQTDETSGD